jgi:TRAP-type C4-dicarboxylate transport system permease small subunit
LKLIRKLSDFIYSIEKILAFLLALTLLLAMVGGFFFRYVLKSPLFWSDELAIFCLIWITFIGASMVLKEKTSPTITFLIDSVPKRFKKYFLIVSNIVLLAFVGYVLYLAINWISTPNILVQRSTSMDMPKIYFYLSIPISFAFSTIHVMNNVIESFKSEDHKEEGALQ